jgi:hypothetical protein
LLYVILNNRKTKKNLFYLRRLQRSLNKKSDSWTAHVKIVAKDDEDDDPIPGPEVPKSKRITMDEKEPRLI